MNSMIYDFSIFRLTLFITIETRFVESEFELVVKLSQTDISSLRLFTLTSNTLNYVVLLIFTKNFFIEQHRRSVFMNNLF